MASIRFGVAVDRVDSGDDLAQLARRFEAAHFDIMLVPDHLFTMSPDVALAWIAASTERLRIGTLVYNNDLRHPAIVAQQAATLDHLSGGRFELGLGAGWNEPEYRSTGLAFDRASIRIQRMEEAAALIRRLMSGEEVTHAGEHYRLDGHRVAPQPPQGAAMPIHIGGNGDKLLAAAARQSDIVGISPYGIGPNGLWPSHFGGDRIAERIDHVRRHAGDRFSELEINVPVQRIVVTDDRDRALEALAERMAEQWETAPSAAELSESPFVFIGTHEQLADQFRHWHESHGISFFSAWARDASALEPVVASIIGF